MSDTSELVAAMRRRADNIERNGVLGVLLYEPVLDGPRAVIKRPPAPQKYNQSTTAKTKWRSEGTRSGSYQFCYHCGVKTWRREIEYGPEKGTVFCSRCGSGFNRPRLMAGSGIKSAATLHPEAQP